MLIPVDPVLMVGIGVAVAFTDTTGEVVFGVGTGVVLFVVCVVGIPIVTGGLEMATAVVVADG